MKLRFTREEWDRMDNKQRIQKCVRLAQEAQALAKAEDGCQAMYLELANQWLTLAAEIQATDALRLRAVTEDSRPFI